MYWKALSKKEILDRVNYALSKNKNYNDSSILGVPGTYLDEKEFYQDADFLKNAAYLKTLIANPNHIGCHSINDKSSPIFKGTHQIENELIKLCAETIFKGEEGKQDGYVATGGTEANIQAAWIYRNYFRKEYKADLSQIGLIYTEDAHYSLSKASDLLQLKSIVLKVKPKNRQIDTSYMKKRITAAKNSGIRYFIVVLSIGTTLYGSVDSIDPIASFLEESKSVFKLHLDAAFGGFIYPFTNPQSKHSFENPRVNSISIDAHKMLQTPFGTGIFLIKKGLMQYVANSNAQYVPGLDYTLCGSRSGANAIAIWMILMSYGSEKWTQKMNKLIKRTDYLCEQLDSLNIKYFRNPHLNIVFIDSKFVSQKLASNYELVADSYDDVVTGWKIVVMTHVSKKILESFLEDLRREIAA